MGVAMAQTVTLLLCGVVFLVLSYLFKYFFINKKQLPLPPGPKGAFLLGNIADLPPSGGHQWEHWIKHKGLYGPISSVTIFGQTMVFVHDLALALEILDKRGAKYSSMARMVFAGDMCGYNERMPFQSNNKIFRQQRKLAGVQIGTTQAVARFHPVMELEVRRLLLRTLNKPDDLISHLETESASFMLKTLYGYTPAPHSPDPLVRLINKVMSEFSQAVMVGAWMVDMIPWLRHLPGWLPGMGFKATARLWRTHSDQVMNVPVDFAVAQMKEKKAKPSYVERLLSANPNAEDEKHIRQSATALYAGGADSTAAGLSFFFLAMTAFPEIQKKAQEEIDRVVGRERLPRFEDRPNLPYVDAVLKETLRWRPLAPLGPPHMIEEDDEFHGYRIPKGTMVLPNIKSFALDPEMYPDPESFKPERFLGPDPAPNPYTYVFGFGRRICPGRLLADSNMFITVAQSLAAFNIAKPIDERTGKEMEPSLDVSTGLVAHPVPFKAVIVPRSEQYARMLRDIESEHPWEEGDAEQLVGMNS